MKTLDGKFTSFMIIIYIYSCYIHYYCNCVLHFSGYEFCVCERRQTVVNEAAGLVWVPLGALKDKLPRQFLLLIRDETSSCPIPVGLSLFFFGVFCCRLERGCWLAHARCLATLICSGTRSFSSLPDAGRIRSPNRYHAGAAAAAVTGNPEKHAEWSQQWGGVTSAACSCASQLCSQRVSSCPHYYY